MGRSSAVDCRDLFDRREMQNQAQFESGDDPVANLGAITLTATTSCTDALAPGDSAYDNARAAGDLERLRSSWDVPRLAVLGIGSSARVALAFAGSHPDKVARLVLDSPSRTASAPRWRPTNRPGPAGRARRVRHPVRGDQLPARARIPKGRRERPAGRCAGRP